MLKIRLQRVGRKNDPSFRVILTEQGRGPKSGAFIEILGSYDPRKDRVQLKTDRIKHWILKGAQVSGTVHNLLINEKVIEGDKINVTPPKREKKPAETHQEEPKAEEPKAEKTEEKKQAKEGPAEEPKTEEPKEEESEEKKT